MMAIRKTLLVREVVEADAMGRPCAPITRVAAMAVVRNPLAGQALDDLSTLFDIGATEGKRLAELAATALPRAAVAYGKAALVGVAGEMEHGGALVHPKLGAPMRAAVGGGAAVIPSNVKLAALGGSIDLPLGHKDDPWSFDHFDTMTLVVPDAPLPDEIVLCVAYADGGRANPRCGEGPVKD